MKTKKIPLFLTLTALTLTTKAHSIMTEWQLLRTSLRPLSQLTPSLPLSLPSLALRRPASAPIKEFCSIAFCSCRKSKTALRLSTSKKEDSIKHVLDEIKSPYLDQWVNSSPTFKANVQRRLIDYYSGPIKDLPPKLNPKKTMAFFRALSLQTVNTNHPLWKKMDANHKRSFVFWIEDNIKWAADDEQHFQTILKKVKFKMKSTLKP